MSCEDKEDLHDETSEFFTILFVGAVALFFLCYAGLVLVVIALAYILIKYYIKKRSEK